MKFCHSSKLNYSLICMMIILCFMSEDRGDLREGKSGLPPFGGPGSKLVHRRSCDDGRLSGRR